MVVVGLAAAMHELHAEGNAVSAHRRGHGLQGGDAAVFPQRRQIGQLGAVGMNGGRDNVMEFQEAHATPDGRGPYWMFPYHRTGMLLYGNWLYCPIGLKDPDQPVNLGMLPGGPSAPGTRHVLHGGTMVAIPQQAKHWELAWEFLKQVRNRIPDAEKVALARQVAAFLALDVNRSAAAEGDEKRIVEERIEVGEELLELLVGRGVGGNVRGAMTGGGPTADLDMKLELIKWVGAEGEQGALNEGPWNVPVGGLPAQP